MFYRVSCECLSTLSFVLDRANAYIILQSYALVSVVPTALCGMLVSVWKEIYCKQRANFYIQLTQFLSAGTALGKGVYFARDASFSMKYTPQSAGGSRFVYLARVLVGRYCHGDSKLVVPPPRDPLRPEILFDSVVDDKTNPRIFVVFSDSQCYPEYLITFWWKEMKAWVSNN